MSVWDLIGGLFSGVCIFESRWCWFGLVCVLEGLASFGVMAWKCPGVARRYATVVSSLGKVGEISCNSFEESSRMQTVMFRRSAMKMESESPPQPSCLECC